MSGPPEGLSISLACSFLISMGPSETAGNIILSLPWRGVAHDFPGRAGLMDSPLPEPGRVSGNAGRLLHSMSRHGHGIFNFRARP